LRRLFLSSFPALGLRGSVELLFLLSFSLLVFLSAALRDGVRLTLDIKREKLDFSGGFTEDLSVWSVPDLPGIVQNWTWSAALGCTDQVGVIIFPILASWVGRCGWWMMGGLFGLVGLGRVIGSQNIARRPFSLGGLKGSDSFSLVARMDD